MATGGDDGEARHNVEEVVDDNGSTDIDYDDSVSDPNWFGAEEDSEDSSEVSLVQSGHIEAEGAEIPMTDGDAREQERDEGDRRETTRDGTGDLPSGNDSPNIARRQFRLDEPEEEISDDL